MWVGLAAFFSVLAPLSALLAPVSTLAKEVRSGQLSGIFHAIAVSGSGGLDTGSGDVPQAGAHCIVPFNVCAA